jgi:hypothetical protein
MSSGSLGIKIVANRGRERASGGRGQPMRHCGNSRWSVRGHFSPIRPANAHFSASRSSSERPRPPRPPHRFPTQTLRCEVNRTGWYTILNPVPTKYDYNYGGLPKGRCPNNPSSGSSLSGDCLFTPLLFGQFIAHLIRINGTVPSVVTGATIGGSQGAARRQLRAHDATHKISRCVGAFASKLCLQPRLQL